jgi:hypothetical protein
LLCPQLIRACGTDQLSVARQRGRVLLCPN